MVVGQFLTLRHNQILNFNLTNSSWEGTGDIMKAAYWYQNNLKELYDILIILTIDMNIDEFHALKVS